jgi:hypothetical protein
MFSGIAAVLGSKLIIAFVTPLLLYFAVKAADKIGVMVPSELLPIFAAALGATVDQVQAMSGAPCPADMTAAACTGLSTLLGLAGTGLHQMVRQLRDAKRQGGFTPPVAQS